MLNFTLIGASWCPACLQARQWLDAHGVVYWYRDVDTDAAAKAKTTKIPRFERTSCWSPNDVDVVEGFDPVKYGKLAIFTPPGALGQTTTPPSQLGLYVGIGATIGLAAGLFWFLSQPDTHARRGTGPRSSQLRSWGAR